MKRKFSRRTLLKSSATVAAGLGSSWLPTAWASDGAPYEGTLLVTLQLKGGADVTQFCDPKVNVPGERRINNWADLARPGQAGNIRYAPFADNANLFERFGLDMLVVNGVDAQTNSHLTGQLYNWTGSNTEGLPSLTALHAAVRAPNQPLAYAVYGGTSRTAGLIRFTRLDDPEKLAEIVRPEAAPWKGIDTIRPKFDVETAHQLVQAHTAELLGSENITPRQRFNLSNLQAARATRSTLARLEDFLPDEGEIQQPERFSVGPDQFVSTLKLNTQVAFSVFKAGLGCSADLVLDGFDSHDLHDGVSEILLEKLADALYFFWDEAEAQGLADRILLVIGSDFGRTNHYNDGDGKDHWPIGSYVIMERDAAWGNRVVGATDELHFARRINPATLQVDAGGVILKPSHVHKALQNYLGLSEFAESRRLNFSGIEEVDLFAPDKQTNV